MIPLEIFSAIFNYLPFESGINMLMCCKTFYYNLCFKTIECNKLNVNNRMFLLKTQSLSVNHIKVLDFGHFKYLETLNISNCNVEQSAITNLTTLVNLDCSYNNKIADLNHMINLKTLNISDYNCSVNQAGISNLRNITHLNVNNNNKIFDINHLTCLTNVNIGGFHSCINQSGILNVTSLTHLVCDDNLHVQNLNHLINLQVLYINNYSAVNQNGISSLTTLIELYCNNNKKISNASKCKINQTQICI